MFSNIYKVSKIDKKILIVEDDALTLTMLSEILKEEGFSVVEAVDGREAIDIALKECPNLILLDIIIPEIDGIGVFKRLREDGCCKDTPIILLTNFEKTAAITDALELGKCDFMIKTDWEIKDIVGRVKTHLGAL